MTHPSPSSCRIILLVHTLPSTSLAATINHHRGISRYPNLISRRSGSKIPFWHSFQPHFVYYILSLRAGFLRYRAFLHLFQDCQICLLGFVVCFAFLPDQKKLPMARRHLSYLSSVIRAWWRWQLLLSQSDWTVRCGSVGSKLYHLGGLINSRIYWSRQCEYLMIISLS
jgi:hypothetical protein